MEDLRPSLTITHIMTRLTIIGHRVFDAMLYFPSRDECSDSEKRSKPVCAFKHQSNQSLEFIFRYLLWSCDRCTGFIKMQERVGPISFRFEI